MIKVENIMLVITIKDLEMRLKSLNLLLAKSVI